MQSLHGQDLSERTRSALHRLEMCFSDSGGATANIPGLGGASEEQAEQIVEEYIFCQPANADGIHYKVDLKQETLSKVRFDYKCQLQSII